MSTELRVYLTLEKLQRQFASYLSSPTSGRGYVPVEGMSSLIVEIAPGLSIERITDIALKAVPALEPGLLVVERQYGVLELHSRDIRELRRAGDAMLTWLNLSPQDQLKPEILFMDVVEEISDQHAVIINRSNQASMVLPGENLLLLEIVPALFATYAANEAERVVPEIKLVDVRMIGATGRLYLSGSAAAIGRAVDHIRKSLEALPGRRAGAGKS